MGPLEELYFNWLCAKVLDVNSPNYIQLMQVLHNNEFVWINRYDENRAADGVELREYFLMETRLTADPQWFDIGCSVLEMLIAFANRAAFETDISTRDWFWEFLTNLNLNEYRQVAGKQKEEIEDILHTFLWRTYNSSGEGGLFPMCNPEQDQRKVEIWYQFCEYLDQTGRL